MDRRSWPAAARLRSSAEPLLRFVPDDDQNHTRSAPLSPLVSCSPSHGQVTGLIGLLEAADRGAFAEPSSGQPLGWSPEPPKQGSSCQLALPSVLQPARMAESSGRVTDLLAALAGLDISYAQPAGGVRSASREPAVPTGSVQEASSSPAAQAPTPAADGSSEQPGLSTHLPQPPAEQPAAAADSLQAAAEHATPSQSFIASATAAPLEPSSQPGSSQAPAADSLPAAHAPAAGHRALDLPAQQLTRPTGSVGLVYDVWMEQHIPPGGAGLHMLTAALLSLCADKLRLYAEHQEQPGRTRAIWAALTSSGLAVRCKALLSARVRASHVAAAALLPPGLKYNTLAGHR